MITGHHTAGTVKNRLAFFQLFVFKQVLAQWANQLLNSLTNFCSHHFQERFCCENEKRNNAAKATDRHFWRTVFMRSPLRSRMIYFLPRMTQDHALDSLVADRKAAVTLCDFAGYIDLLSR